MGSLRSLMRRERSEPLKPPISDDGDLIYAIIYCTITVVRILLNRGANVNAVNERGTPALAIAAYNGRLRIVQALVKRGADVNQRDSDGSTALHLAISARWEMVPDICLFLLNRGADVNAADSNGNTPLMTAVLSREFELAKVLLERGADATLRRHDGKRALDMLGRGRETTAMRELLKPVS